MSKTEVVVVANKSESKKALSVDQVFGEQLGLSNVAPNRLILGENSAALGALSHDEQILGKVDLIYIDPPFATNGTFHVGEERTSTVSSSKHDTIAYEDKLIGDEFLQFLRKRLTVLRALLSDSGSIYLHIDVKMGHFVKVIMDEVFGEQNFINDITRIKSNPKNFSRRAFGNSKDMILFYSKTGNHIWNDPRDPLTNEDIKRRFPKKDAAGRRYTTTPLHAPGETKDGPTGQPWRGLQPPPGRHWRQPPDELERLDRNGLIEWSSTGNPRKIIYADDAARKGKKMQDIWEFKDPFYPNYPTQKNFEMLKVIVEASSNPGSLVLDSFCGSGTTLIAAEQLGRRWIGIDQSPHAIDVCRERILSEGNGSMFEVCSFGTLTSEGAAQ